MSIQTDFWPNRGLTHRDNLKLFAIESTAATWAELATCSSRAKVGAVLFTDDWRVVSTGYNGSPQRLPHCDEVGCIKDEMGSCLMAVHAEVNAILQCAQNGVSTDMLNLYVTHSPCSRCAIVIVRAGIHRVVFGQVYGSAIEHVTSIFDQAKVRFIQRR